MGEDVTELRKLEQWVRIQNTLMNSAQQVEEDLRKAVALAQVHLLVAVALVGVGQTQ